MIALPSVQEPRVSIVVVTARRPDRLLRCLAAVERDATAAPPYEVIVVLNAAEPAMAERLASDVTGARVVVSEIPLGFAGGSNLGARHARGELLHLLHDDAEVCSGWLSALAGALDAHPEAGAAGSLVLDFAGTVQTAGYLLWRDGSTSPPWIGPPPGADGFGDAYVVDYCGSASLLVRRAAWDAIGGFDEGFHPAYYVDVDLAMSLRAAGYAVLCEPSSRVRHERGGSSGEAFRAFVSARNRERFIVKWKADLAHQEPRAEGEEALARARAATARRAASIGPRTEHGTAPARLAPAAEDELARARRERRQLELDVAVKDAFIAHAERLLAEAAATRARLESDGVTAQRALAELHEEHAAVNRRYAALRQAYEELEADRDRLAAERSRRGLRRVRDSLDRLRRRVRDRTRRGG